MKILLFASLLLAQSKLIWDQLTIDPHLRGTYYPTYNYWTPGLIQCNHQCQHGQGLVCGITQKQCCQQGKCSHEFGFQVCKELVKDFVCSVKDKSPYKLSEVFSAEAFPELEQVLGKGERGSSDEQKVDKQGKQGTIDKKDS